MSEAETIVLSNKVDKKRTPCLLIWNCCLWEGQSCGDWHGPWMLIPENLDDVWAGVIIIFPKPVYYTQDLLINISRDSDFSNLR